MGRKFWIALILFCGGLVVSCTSPPPPANTEAVLNALDPIVTRTITFTDMYAREIEEPLIALLRPEEQVMVYPQPDMTTSKTLLIKARTSTLEIIVNTMHAELDRSPNPHLLLAADTADSERTPLILAETTTTSETTTFDDEQDAMPAEENNDRRTHIYHVKHGTASALKRLLDEVYGISGKQTGYQYNSGETFDIASPKFIASDVATGTEDYALGGGWDNLGDVPGAVGNFLIIVATSEQYANILELLKEIDGQPLQVFLNMLIAEVTLLDDEVFGIEETLFGQAQVAVGGENNTVSSLATTEFQEVADNLEGFRYALLAPGRFLLKLRALVTENRVRLLSNPHIFVRNNRKAKIHIGETIPVVTHETTSEGDVRETIDLKETGITLAVVPSINPNGNVHLEIMQEVTDVGSDNYGGTGRRRSLNA